MRFYVKRGKCREDGCCSQTACCWEMVGLAYSADAAGLPLFWGGRQSVVWRVACCNVCRLSIYLTVHVNEQKTYCSQRFGAISNAQLIPQLPFYTSARAVYITLKLSYVVRGPSLTLLCAANTGSNFLCRSLVAHSPKSLALSRVCLAGFVRPTAHHFWRVVACEAGVRFRWFLSPAPIRHARADAPYEKCRGSCLARRVGRATTYGVEEWSCKALTGRSARIRSSRPLTSMLCRKINERINESHDRTRKPAN